MKITPTFRNLQNILTPTNKLIASLKKQSIYSLNASDAIIVDDTLQTKHIQIHTKGRINSQHLGGIRRLEPHCSIR